MTDIALEVVLGAIAGFVWFLLVSNSNGRKVFQGVTKRGGRLVIHIGFVVIAALVAHYTARNFVGGLAVGWAVTEGPHQTLFKEEKSLPDQDANDDISTSRHMGSRIRKSALAKLGDWYFNGK